MDKRHVARVKLVQKLYAAHWSEQSLDESVKAIVEHEKKIDKLIHIAAPRFPVDKIALVDLSILRLAIWELKFEKKTPPKVIINEAVELAKDLGSERSPAFVNAVLGKIYNRDNEKNI